jgi:hypothetical protein
LYNYYSIYDYYAFMNANYGDMFVVEPPSIDSKLKHATILSIAILSITIKNATFIIMMQRGDCEC